MSTRLHALAWWQRRRKAEAERDEWKARHDGVVDRLLSTLVAHAEAELKSVNPPVTSAGHEGGMSDADLQRNPR